MEQAGLKKRRFLLKNRALLNIATATKIAFSKQDSVEVDVFGWKGTVTREQFEDLIRPLVKKTRCLVVVH